jgi:hypothetical protein
MQMQNAFKPSQRCLALRLVRSNQLPYTGALPVTKAHSRQHQRQERQVALPPTAEAPAPHEQHPVLPLAECCCRVQLAAVVAPACPHLPAAHLLLRRSPPMLLPVAARGWAAAPLATRGPSHYPAQPQVQRLEPLGAALRQGLGLLQLSSWEMQLPPLA